MTFNAFTGIASGGPWHGKVKTFQTRRVLVANNGATWVTGGELPGSEGTYFYRDASGPTPGKWLWVAAAGSKEKT
jgi:hypothetical protein